MVLRPQPRRTVVFATCVQSRTIERFIDSVKEYQTAGSEGNRQKFLTFARESSEPLGLLAYQDSAVVAWCAVGPTAVVELCFLDSIGDRRFAK
jgi:hypothetical protein